METVDVFIQWALAIATLVVVLLTVLPMLRHPHWIVRGLDFPRLQLAVGALVVVLLHLGLQDFDRLIPWLLMAATATCLACQLWWILPYTRLWPREVKSARGADPDRTITILTANVLTPNRNAGALIGLVEQHQPDILVTLESDQWWEDQLELLGSRMPYGISCPQDNLYGMHVFSRLPLLESECRFLVEDKVPSMHALVQLRSGNRIRVHFLHPAPPSPTENTESAERDAELVIVGRSVADTDEPVIVTGDLNDVAWSPTTRLFRKVSGLLDPRVGRGMFNTFHADYPLLRWPLDHLFHSEHFTLVSLRRLPSIGSDHFPLLASLRFAPLGGRGQEPLQGNREDDQRARELAQDQGVSKNDVPEPGHGTPTNHRD